MIGSNDTWVWKLPALPCLLANTSICECRQVRDIVDASQPAAESAAVSSAQPQQTDTDRQHAHGQPHQVCRHLPEGNLQRLNPSTIITDAGVQSQLVLGTIVGRFKILSRLGRVFDVIWSKQYIFSYLRHFLSNTPQTSPGLVRSRTEHPSTIQIPHWNCVPT